MNEAVKPIGSAKDAVKLRQRVKARKPKFKRQESWRYKRVKKRWRKPRGLDNKMGSEIKGWPKRVKIGYGGPKRARHLHPSGFKEVLLHTPSEVNTVDPTTQAIRIAHTVGQRKRIQITALARERKVYILNPIVRKEAEEIEEIEEESSEEPASTRDEGTLTTKKTEINRNSTTEK
jgi:large subunit ribosomal protein L32e